MECKLEAFHDHMPGPDKKGKTLRVTGTCEAPTPGYKLRLEPGNGGINPNPKYVYLDLVVEEPKGGVPDVMTTTEIDEYEEQMSSEKTKVVVNGAEPSDVKITHTK